MDSSHGLDQCSKKKKKLYLAWLRVTHLMTIVETSSTSSSLSLSVVVSAVSS